MHAVGDLSERVTRAAIELALAQLPAESLARLLARAPSRFDGRATARTMELASSAASSDALGRMFLRYGGDVLELLNACRIEELGLLLRSSQPRAVPAAPRAGALRWALWQQLLAGASSASASSVSLIGDRLVACAPPRGLSPPAAQWPRPLPAPIAPAPPHEEPECLDTLLDAADRAIGVRLGQRGRDGKGAWGQRAAELLGVIDRGDCEPDWRGDVEIKTVAVARASSRAGRSSGGDGDDRGAWRVVEDPAISTVGATPLTKLQRVLWLCRADAEEGDATLISWYLLDWDEAIAGLVERYLHVRPKGPRGSAGKGFYLHKRFFADAGLLASLNGP